MICREQHCRTKFGSYSFEEIVCQGKMLRPHFRFLESLDIIQTKTLNLQYKRYYLKKVRDTCILYSFFGHLHFFLLTTVKIGSITILSANNSHVLITNYL